MKRDGWLTIGIVGLVNSLAACGNSDSSGSSKAVKERNSDTVLTGGTGTPLRQGPGCVASRIVKGHNIRPGSQLEGADLSEAKLGCADLSGANLYKADLSSAHLIDANLATADLSYANMVDASLDDAHLRDANLTGADLTHASLNDTDLTGANLAAGWLTGTDLRGANLTGTDLTGVRWDEFTKWPDGFTPPPSG